MWHLPVCGSVRWAAHAYSCPAELPGRMRSRDPPIPTPSHIPKRVVLHCRGLTLTWRSEVTSRLAPFKSLHAAGWKALEIGTLACCAALCCALLCSAMLYCADGQSWSGLQARPQQPHSRQSIRTCAQWAEASSAGRASPWQHPAAAQGRASVWGMASVPGPRQLPTKCSAAAQQARQLPCCVDQASSALLPRAVTPLPRTELLTSPVSPYCLVL